MPEFVTQQSLMNPVALNLNNYQSSDIDDAGTTQYFGYLNAVGQWIVAEYNTAASPKTMRYAKGKHTYTTNWTNRASLTYQHYNDIFS